MGTKVRYRWLVVATAASLVLYGIVGLAPHTHGDETVPRFDTACAASGSPVPLTHLHRSAPLLPGHACLACLIGPAAAAIEGHVGHVVGLPSVVVTVEALSRGIPRAFRDLPSQRAPPVAGA